MNTPINRAACTAIAIVLLAIGKPAIAQRKALSTFGFGVVDEVLSNELGEKRTLNIYLPEGYSPDSAARYPVIYLLDGSAHEDYAHVAGIVEFMSTYALMPRSIMVGIANIDRQRDFTFPSGDPEDIKAAPTSGGSAKFIAFLEKDLEPYIEAHYRTAKPRTIIGQSLGGLLATEILLRKPDLFDDYIIVSPSLWWNKDSLAKEAASLLRARPELTKRIYVALGSEGDEMLAGVDKLLKGLKDFKPKCTVWYVPFPAETHATILHRAVYKAFELLNKPQ